MVATRMNDATKLIIKSVATALHSTVATAVQEAVTPAMQQLNI